MSSINVKYFGLPSSPATTAVTVVDSKENDKETHSQQRFKMLKNLLTNRTKGGKTVGHGISINLTIPFNGASAAVTAQAPVIAVCPGTSTEFASLANLFDEMKCVGATVHMRIFSASATQTSGWGAAFAYDPSNTGTYSSVAQVLEAEQHLGPLSAPSAGASTLVAAPASHTKSGFYVWKIKVPKGPHVHDPNVLSFNGTGEWTSTGVSTTTYGNVKGYLEAAGAGATQFNGYIIMHCVFRVRT